MRKLLLALAASSFAAATAFAQPVINDLNLTVSVAVTGLTQPTSMAFIGPDDFLVLQKNDGKVMRVTNGVLNPIPVLDVDVDPRSFGGLLSIVLHPDFASNQYVYLFFTEGGTGSDTVGMAVANRVYRYTWDGGAGTLISPTLIIELPVATMSGNYSGIMAFGPDGRLYITVGDLGRTGQLQNNLAGAVPDDTSVILRLNEDGTTPKNNPFFSQGGVAARYFAYGIRNSFGMAFDPVTGKLWNTENGPANWDEINLVERGFNSGWNKLQGPLSQDAESETVADLFTLPRSRYADPKFSWFESIGITGIVFLDSAQLGAEYENNMFVGDYVFGNLSRFQLNKKRDGLALFDGLADKIASNANDRNDARLGWDFGSISALTVGPDGLLYVVSISDGAVYVVHRVVEVGAMTVPDGDVGAPYNADLNISGGTAPYTVTVLSGSLPPGLSIAGSSLAGTPTKRGRSAFTLEIAETGGAVSVMNYAMRIYRALAVTTGHLRKGRIGRNYAVRLRASGGKKTYSWTITAGALPAGLNIAGDMITGTPSASGVANFTLQVTDSLGATAERALSLTIK
jgi:glucose/arabinose dehydrogenase